MPRINPRSNAADMLPLTAAVFSILLALAAGEKHGYAIMKDVALAEGGAISIGPGTLYGSLDRMLAARLVEETGFTDDDRRRYYRITRFGAEVLAAESERLTRAIGSALRKGVLKEARP